MRELDIGNSNFKDIIDKNYYYIDKSLFIREVLKSQKQVLLLPRPRRFGKTLNMSMLKYFFEKDKPENENLFTHLKIQQQGEDIQRHRGKYPVLFLSFKDAKADNWEKTLLHIKMEIAAVFREHQYILNSELITDIEKKEYSQVMDTSANEVLFETSIKHLSNYLERYHGQKTVILIDEYDAPIQSGYQKFYQEVVSFMRNLLSGAFKDNNSLFKGVITGILRVSRESIFSGLNNLSVYSILDEEFADSFGFTKEEVKNILTDFEIPSAYKQVKEWYDGYTIGETTDIYNPWSILNYTVGHKKGFMPYWINTSSDSLLKDYIKAKQSEDARQTILKLISGESIQKPIEENFVFPDLKTNHDLLWTLLTFSGYLTIKRKISLGYYEICVPNYEIQHVFRNIILHWFQNEVQIYRGLLEDTGRALVRGKMETFAEGFRQIAGDTFSYYDTEKTPEKVYQAYLLGLLAILTDEYVIRSNRESGKGRYDILLIPRDKNQNGVVMELKSIAKKKSRERKAVFLERVAREKEAALQQIEENEYYRELQTHNIENILKVAIIFAGKEIFF